jgi:hypothetical protein
VLFVSAPAPKLGALKKAPAPLWKAPVYACLAPGLLLGLLSVERLFLWTSPQTVSVVRSLSKNTPNKADEEF